MRRILVFSLPLLLAACSGTPQDYGITGPDRAPTPVSPALPDTAPDATPGVSTTGTFYGPTNGPTSGTNGFWGYN